MINLSPDTGVINTILSLPTIMRQLSDGGSSYEEYTSSTRVEPTVAIESLLEHQSYMPNLMKAITSFFASYYLQAAEISNRIGDDITIKSRLDELNPSRDFKIRASVESSMIVQNFDAKLPTFSSGNSYSYNVARESINVSVEASKDTIRSIKNIDSLATGVMVEVTLREGSDSITMPINVRPKPVAVDTDVLINAFGMNSYANQPTERLKRMVSGDLEGWRDIVLATDMIDTYKKTRRKDKSGFFKKMSKAKRNNIISMLMSGKAGIGVISSIVIISKTTATQLAMELEIDLDDADRRNATIFDNTIIMQLVVVDESEEKVRIYHRNNSDVTDLTFSALASGGKHQDSLVSDLLTAYSSQPAKLTL